MRQTSVAILVLAALAALAFVAWRSLGGPEAPETAAGAPDNMDPKSPDMPLRPSGPPEAPAVPATGTGGAAAIPPPPPPVAAPAGRTLTGRILKVNGDPAEGYVVVGLDANLRIIEGRWTAPLGPDGRFTLEGPWERGSRLAVVGGSAGADRSLYERPAEVLPLFLANPQGEGLELADLRMNPPVVVEGTVHGVDGSPLEGVRVEFELWPSGLGRRATTSGPGGVFRFFEVGGGPCRLRAERASDDGVPLVAFAEDDWAGGPPVVLELRPATGLRLIFRDPSGAEQVVRPERVRLLEGKERTPTEFRGPRRKALLAGFPPGRRRLAVEATGYEPVDLGEVEIPESGLAERDVVLIPE